MMSGSGFDKQFASLPFVVRTEHAYAIAHGNTTPITTGSEGLNRPTVASVRLFSVPLLAFASIMLFLYLILSGGGSRFASAL